MENQNWTTPDLKEGERLDDLQIKGYRIIQDPAAPPLIMSNFESAVLQGVAAFYVARFLRRCDDPLAADHSRVFVDYHVFDMDVFSDHNVCGDHAVLYNGARFDDASSSDDGVLNASVDEAAVGNNGGCYFTVIEVLGRAGVVRTCVDRPVRAEEVGCVLQVDE